VRSRGDIWNAAAETGPESAIPPGEYRATDASNLPSSLGSAFAGQPFDGTWMLVTRDNQPLDVGQITSFTISGITIIPTCRPCRADFNNDGILNPDDLSDFINCYFDTPPAPTSTNAAS